MKATRLAVTLVAISLTFSITRRSAAENLIYNGDFEFGNVGFASQLTFVASGQFPSSGSYGITQNPHDDIWSAFGDFGDHTTGFGLMFAADASAEPSTIAWQAAVTVPTAGVYEFSGWAASMGQFPIGNPVDPSPARLRLFVNDVQVGSDFEVLDSNGQWARFSASVLLATSGIATLKIIDVNTDLVGNDFTLDDLSFRTVPEPSSLLILGSGLAGVAFIPSLCRRFALRGGQLRGGDIPNSCGKR